MAKEDSFRPNYWQNLAILHRFNCCAVSHTTESSNKVNDVEGKISVKKRTKGGWKTLPFIIGNEASEKLAVVGLNSNKLVYLSTQYNIKMVTLVNIMSIISGTTSLATLGGAILADSYIGRFRPLLIGSLSYLLAMSLWTLTTLISQLRPAYCTDLQAQLGKCEKASKEQLLYVAVAFLFMSIASATIRPCAMPFGADQFQQEGPMTPKGNKRLQSFFNWYFFASCFSQVIAGTVIVYLQSNVSWSLGYGVCAIFMFVSIVVFLIGIPIFRHEIPKGSPLTAIAQVFVAAIRKRNLSLPSDPEVFYRGQNDNKVTVKDRFRFMNKAAIPTEGDIRADGSVARPWKLSSINLIDDLKPVIGTLPILSCTIPNAIVGASSFDVFQALTMDRRLGSNFQVPAASMHVFSLLTVLAWLPLYDRVLVPLNRRITKQDRGITPLQRMGIGYVISSTSMLVAGLVEVKRRNTATRHGLTDQPRAVVPISVFWLVPQYCIHGLGSAFHSVGHLEFFYSQYPANMRSTAVALSACTSALGSYLHTFFITIVHNTTGRNGKPDWLDNNINRGHLDYFYWLLSALEAVNITYFILRASWYKYRENPLPQDESKEIQKQQGPENSAEI